MTATTTATTATTSTAATPSAGAATTGGSAASGVSAGASTQLAGKFQDFLHLLMTQLQHQDPTSPMDTNQFTTQLVQFASVEQQIDANSSLTSLIQLTQAGEMMQGSSIVGKRVEVASDKLSLQNGSATLRFATASSQPVVIDVYSSAGTKIAETTLRSAQGSNSWTWNGHDANGNQMSDGTYKVTVRDVASDGTTSAQAFTVVGTATGVQKSGNAVKLQLGAQSVDFSAVQSVLGN